MIDILAIVNRKWCGWCVEEDDDTAWNRFWGLNVAEKYEDWSTKKRFAIWWSRFWTEKFKVWRVASWWHYRYHDPKWKRVMEEWVD